MLGKGIFNFVCTPKWTEVSFANAAVKPSVGSGFKTHKDIDVKNTCKTEEGRERKKIWV